MTNKHTEINQPGAFAFFERFPTEDDDSNGSGATMIRLMVAGMTGRRLTYTELKNA